MQKKKVLFLHTELAGYFLACVDALINICDLEVHIVRLPINAEAPFQFNFNEKIKFYDRWNQSDKELIKLCKNISPDFIFCAGWVDKCYLEICQYYYGKIPTLIVLDNHWTGKLKQRVAVLVAPFYLQNKFSHIWIPGLIQYEYARKLGFKKEAILTGMYSADVPKFYNYYLQYKELKQRSFPRRFLYLGRYVSMKGVDELWQAFIELKKEDDNEWELWCAGAGNLEATFPIHPKIKNFGFVQAQAIGDLIKDTGVLVLPSHYEPWGVVIHELAACGMPIICSNKVGAASSFLVDGYNGFLFNANNKDSLKKSMRRIMSLDNEALQKMSARSLELSNTNNPLIWATKIWELIGTFNRDSLA